MTLNCILFHSDNSLKRGSNGDAKHLIQAGLPLVSASNLGNDISIVRFAADSTEDAYKLLADLLSPLAKEELMGLPMPYADRIHSLSI